MCIKLQNQIITQHPLIIRLLKSARMKGKDSTTPLWYALSKEGKASEEEQREFLMGFLPANERKKFVPPLPPGIEIEAVDEIQKIIKRPPKGSYADFIAGKRSG